MNASTADPRRRAGTGHADTKPTLNWPGDPETVAAADVDFEALAHVLANTCRGGGRRRHYHSLAAHAVIVSEEIEALEGLGREDRLALALLGLLAGAASAWLRGEWAGSARAAGRTARLAARIEGAVREAAGLDAAIGEEQAELLRFVARMALAAERRDLLDGEAPAEIAFPPLKRRIRPLTPERAAQAWLARFRELAGEPRGAGNGEAGANGGKDAGKAAIGVSGEPANPDAADV